MAGPSPSWNTIPLEATYRKLDGVPDTGKVVFTVMNRVVSITDDIIFPKGGKIEATLNDSGAIVVAEFPAVDDPDNSPNDWSIKVEEVLGSGGGEIYYIQPKLSMLPDGLNLRSVMVDATELLPPTPVRGVAGGLAELNSLGLVVNEDGTPATFVEKEFTMTGPLLPKVGTHKVYNNTGRTLRNVIARASVDLTPGGAPIIIDVIKMGVTMFTGGIDRPTIFPGSVTDVGSPIVSTWENGTYLTVDVVQVGTEVTGSDLTVQVSGQ